MLVCYAIILILNNIGLVDFFFVERKLECTKIHDLLEMVAECYAAPHFWVQKKVWSPPHLHQPTPLTIDRSLNTPHQRHDSSYLFISAFWGGVVKDREAPFSPNYVHLKNLWSLTVITRFLSANKVVEFDFSRNIMETEYMAQLSRFVYMNAIAFKCIFSLYDQKSVSRLFTAQDEMPRIRRLKFCWNTWQRCGNITSNMCFRGCGFMSFTHVSVAADTTEPDHFLFMFPSCFSYRKQMFPQS